MLNFVCVCEILQKNKVSQQMPCRRDCLHGGDLFSGFIGLVQAINSRESRDTAMISYKQIKLISKYKKKESDQK